jgi:hypothetical protein
MGKKKAKKAPAKKVSTTPKKEFHVTPSSVPEASLLAELTPELLDAWKKFRAFAAALGPQRIYGAHRSIMFARKFCYCFVRPKRSYLEVVVFLPSGEPRPGFKKPSGVSKTKFSHTWPLRHEDEVEGQLTDAIAEAYAMTPSE